MKRRSFITGLVLALFFGSATLVADCKSFLTAAGIWDIFLQNQRESRSNARFAAPGGLLGS